MATIVRDTTVGVRVTTVTNKSGMVIKHLKSGSGFGFGGELDRLYRVAGFSFSTVWQRVDWLSCRSGSGR
jgi:hypothetical protein